MDFNTFFWSHCFKNKKMIDTEKQENGGETRRKRGCDERRELKEAPINLRSCSRGGSTFGTHWSDEVMNDVMNSVMTECFVGAKIWWFVWWWFRSVRERELFWGRWVSVRDRIIKNGKMINILLNKCVE